MGQNTSSAVMQQRSEPHDSLDDFPTPPWATRALCEWLLLRGESIDHFNCREPAANRGYMVAPLREYWQRWMQALPALRVFGFTAWAPDSIVGEVVDALNESFSDRWRVRFSGQALDGRGALVVERPEDSIHVLCPWDAGKVANCGECALCWTMNRTVEFARH